MSDTEKDDSKADTVPPPDGEDDAYNAPTRVGPMDPAILEAMMASMQKPATAEATAASSKTTPPTPPVAEEALSESNLVADEPPSSPGLAAPLQPRLSKPPPVPPRPAPDPPAAPSPVHVAAAPVVAEDALAPLVAESAPAPATSLAPVLILLAVGSAIFAIGLALYLLS